LLQAYVIATSTLVDISKVDVSKFDDTYFKSTEKKEKKKSEDGFFGDQTEEKKELGAEYVENQKKVNSTATPILGFCLMHILNSLAVSSALPWNSIVIVCAYGWCCCTQCFAYMQQQYHPYVHTNTIEFQGSAELVASNGIAHHLKKAIIPFAGTAVASLKNTLLKPAAANVVRCCVLTFQLNFWSDIMLSFFTFESLGRNLGVPSEWCQLLIKQSTH